MYNLQQYISKYKLHLIPTVVVCLYFLYKSLNFNLHDFGNSYFPALMILEDQNPTDLIFDIFQFNQYVWKKGYNDVLLDYYLNSPFCSTFILPITIFKNAYFAKTFFNSISIILFIFSLEILAKSDHSKKLILCFPLLFLIPIQNNILFGQFYFIIFAFTVFAYHFYSKNQLNLASVFIINAAFLKIFPFFFVLPLLKKVKYRILIVSILCISISILFNGFSFWGKYLFKFFPQSMLNDSSIGFEVNAQSLDVLFKHLFIADAFHNPKPFTDSPILFFIMLWLSKSIILGLAIKYFNSTKISSWESLSGIIVALFLLQTRTPTYSLIFWLIPLIFYLNSPKSITSKLIFIILLIVRSNLSILFTGSASVFLQFIPLIISVILGLMFFQNFIKFDSFNELVFAAIIFCPILIKSFSKTDTSQYVLVNKGQFITYDFEVKQSKIIAYSLGKQGKEQTEIRINASSIDTLNCKIINNEIFYKNQLIDLPSSMKKSAILVNHKDIYFLTDYRSRVGWLNLKLISISK